MRKLQLAMAFTLVGCASQATSTDVTTPAQCPLERLVKDAATEANVPVDLLLAIAIEEGGVKLPTLRLVHPDDSVPVAGLLELRHGRLDTLALGAKLMGTTEDVLRGDTDLATHAGARVLASLGAQYGATESLESWRRALEVLSGMDDDNARDYANRVFAILHQGGEFPARAGLTVRLAAHPEIAEVAERTIVAYRQADFPGAIWFTTSCTNKCDVGRPLGNASVNKIVVHDTEAGWDSSVAMLQNDSGKSVHYIVDADGSRVGQFRAETDTTWHAGNYYYNETSIGIEHVGVASDASGYSDDLYATSRALVESIRTRWTIPLDRRHIIGHYQVPDGSRISERSGPCTGTLDACENSANYGGVSNHRDPGFYWQWCQYMKDLGGSCTCNDAWELWNCTTDKQEAVRCANGSVEIAECIYGCDVQPIGVDDVCHTTDDSGSGDMPDGGVPDHSCSANPDIPSGDGSSGAGSISA